jgi:hypothetical protein
VASPRVRCCDARRKKYAPRSSWFQELLGFRSSWFQELLVSRRGRPNRGLALLMRPAKVAPGETFVFLPLCGAPNGLRSSHRGPLTRWKHADLRVTKVTRKNLGLPKGNVKRRSRRRRGNAAAYLCTRPASPRLVPLKRSI